MIDERPSGLYSYEGDIGFIAIDLEYLFTAEPNLGSGI